MDQKFHLLKTDRRGSRQNLVKITNLGNPVKIESHGSEKSSTNTFTERKISMNELMLDKKSKTSVDDNNQLKNDIESSKNSILVEISSKYFIIEERYGLDSIHTNKNLSSHSLVESIPKFILEIQVILDEKENKIKQYFRLFILI